MSNVDRKVRRGESRPLRSFGGIVLMQIQKALVAFLETSIKERLAVRDLPTTRLDMERLIHNIQEISVFFGSSDGD